MPHFNTAAKVANGAFVVRQVAVMSFKRKFNTPTKMAPGNDDDDDVTRRSYDSRPSSARVADTSADFWSSTSIANLAGGSEDATLFPNAFGDTDRLLDFRVRYGLSTGRKPPADRDSTPPVDRERKPELDGGDVWRQPEVDDSDDDVMGNIRSVIGSAATLDEKQRVLSMMISQLQSLKQNLFQQKSNGVSCRLLSNFISSASDRKKNKINQLYNTTQRKEKHRQTFVHIA